jgi:ADP-ribose pyrophosphatase YjhB (NUDIX family)
MTQRYYIESDGRIFLVPRDGKRDLPMREEIPFEFQEIAPLALPDVSFCVPFLDAHPSEWTSKDSVPADPDVSTIVREAVHATMPRVVTEGVFVREDGRILVLKGSRGLTKDRWTLPGGFVRFGEGPAEGLLREIREELGADARIASLLAVRSKLGAHTQLHWTQFFYRVTLRGEIIPNPDEISEARFVHPHEAMDLLADAIMREVIESLLPSSQTTEDPSESTA